MKPDPNDFIHNPPREYIPKEHFFEDLILRSARRIFEGDSDEKPVAPTIKIINLSICDPARIFFHQLSSCAKLVDWLSEKYQVLFCISAGNNGSDIDLEKSEAELNQLTDDELTKHTMTIVHEDIRNHRLMSPADSVNALSIGAIHADKSNISNQGNRVDILPTQELPSPITAHGYGFRNSINPEIYLPGGRQLYDYITDNRYRINDIGMAPGQRAAAEPVNPGERNRGIYIRGTSNSTALASRGAALIYEALNELRSEAETETDIPDKYMAVVIKALLVHGASWDNSFNILENCLKARDNSRLPRKVAARYLGYGTPDTKRVIECTERRATAIGCGSIKKDEKHEFRFPLPPSLSGLNEMRRLIITLAWLSPVNAANRKFRKANLSFDPPGHKAGVKRVNADGRQVKNGTIQHEVLEGSEVVTYQDGDNLKIDVVCREDAGILDESVNYGLAVTLEVAEDVKIPIYEEISQRIEIPIEIDGIS
jgi:Subtilase family.